MKNQEENLALRPQVIITVSHESPTGGGARDPQVLLNDDAHQLDGRTLAHFDRRRTYDTYLGQSLVTSSPTLKIDWYMLTFPEPQSFNCVEMTMGFPHRDGGWWTSLAIEVRLTSESAWQPVEHLTISPPYDFADRRGRRKPFTTYWCTFGTVRAVCVRLIGKPGGIAQLTSLARIAVYQRDLSYWNPLSVVEAPIPQVYRLISPQMIFDLSENLMEVTGLTTASPYLEYYLDAQRYERFWKRLMRNYLGEPDLWFLMGERLGWSEWNRLFPIETTEVESTESAPFVQSIFQQTLAYAVAPVQVDGQIVGRLTASAAIISDHFDWEWHCRNAEELQIDWQIYQAAIERTPKLTLQQLQATANLLGMIANTIANLAHRLEQASPAHDRQGMNRHAVVRRAIDFMEAHLEDHVTVSEVANEVGFTVPYFSTIFTEETHQNPSDFLIHLRITRAKEYFAHTQMTVSEVAEILGYNPNHFSRLFKSRTGYTPMHYTMLIRQK